MKVKVMKIRIADDMVQKDQQHLDDFLRNNEVLKFESAFVSAKESYWSVILYYNEILQKVSEAKLEKYAAENETLSPDEIRILDSLKIWRSEKAREQKLPTYFIATNKELFSVAKYKPARKEELQEIKGFGKHKIENYGEEIIGIIESV
ncbi:HRDC domain-containing protein [Weeksellaceae bacterium A-14]|uniref:HRDC domain-containing protein n=1 Tax=Daejeonia sp. YH14 TaxID=3439042 RepID=UPI0031E49B2E